MVTLYQTHLSPQDLTTPEQCCVAEVEQIQKWRAFFTFFMMNLLVLQVSLSIILFFIGEKFLNIRILYLK